MSDEGDDFWRIALDSAEERREIFKPVDDEDDQDLRALVIKTHKPFPYHLPIMNITLNLTSLAATEGVWSPLGADAWYASALLTNMLLTNNNIFPEATYSNSLTVLELGSGAVGLSGMACAVALNLSKTYENCKVVLTDNDAPVLETLRWNVERNQKTITETGNVEVCVQHLDWNDDCSDDFRDSIDLVIGSELVYTKETALACFSLLEQLLENKKFTEVWVVQVTDRFGWLDIVLPKLKAIGAHIREIPISCHVHDLACAMISMGDAIDREAYGGFCISRKEDVYGK
jgi:predicted nicotinamide N-methyase